MGSVSLSQFLKPVEREHENREWKKIDNNNNDGFQTRVGLIILIFHFIFDSF